MGVARNSSGPFQRVSRQAELVSYGEWQELILAILEGSQHRLNWLVLAIFKWQGPVLAILEGCRHRLNWLVMGSGKNRFLPFSSGKNRFLPFRKGVDTG